MLPYFHLLLTINGSLRVCRAFNRPAKGSVKVDGTFN
jgi:hypothetical protein